MRRGGVALEFALTAPVLLTLLAGVVEWGNYFPNQRRVQEAARTCVRTGSQTDQDDGPEAAAEAAGAAALVAAGIPTADASIAAVVSGSSPDLQLQCSIQVPYAPLMGLVPTVGTLSAEITMRLEDQ